MRNKLSWGSKHSVLPRLPQSRSHVFLVWCGRTQHQRLLSLAARQIYRWKIYPVMLSNQRQPYQTTRQSNRSRAQDPVWVKVKFASLFFCLVVVPLVALMKDQVASLVARGISAASVGADCTREQVKEISEGKYALVFGSPKLYWIATKAFLMENSGKTLRLFLSM